MKAEELINVGFKKITIDNGYWYELTRGNHVFLTNDNTNNGSKDSWYIGY